MPKKTVQETTGARMRRVREECGWTREDLAYEIRSRHGRRVNSERIRYYEVERPESIDLELLVQIADILERPLSDFSPERDDYARKFADLLLKTCSRCYGPLDDLLAA